MTQFLHPSPGILRVFVACLLSFTILITPIAAVAAPSIAKASTVKNNDGKKRDQAKSAAAELFVNPPSAMLASALPGPQPQPAPEPLAPMPPPPAAVTATMAGLLVDKDADAKLDPTTGVAGTTERVDYTVQLSNTSGAPATGLNFNVPLDSHTTLVPGSLNSTPIAFDQNGLNGTVAITTNEDPAVPPVITLQGQDPDGSALTFSIVAPPTNGSLGSIGSVSCVSGVCSANVTYTPNLNFNGADSFTFKVNDGTADSNQTGAVSITVNAVNDPPTFTAGANQAVNEDAGVQSVSSFITNVSPGPANESAQTVSFVITNVTHPALFSSQPAINVSGTNATLTYTPGADKNGTSTITYHAHDTGGVANGGVDNSPDATFTITVNAVNDAPVATAKSFTVQANLKITGLSGLLSGATDPDATNGAADPLSFDAAAPAYTSPNVTLTSVTLGTCTNGVISNINTAGSFDFDPPPGLTGSCVLKYQVTDTGKGSGGNQTSAAADITITLNGPVIWFVNPGAGPDTTHTGTLANPFQLLASANTAMGLNAGQRIFVFTGTTTSGVGVSLTTSQWLIGQGATNSGNTSNFDTFMGISPPANTIARPAVNGTKPTIQGRVQMNASNTRVQGVAIAPPAGTQGLTATNGVAMTGMQVGVSATQSDVTVTATGNSGGNALGVSLNNAGGVFTFISVNVNQAGASQPAKGISVTNLATGSFTVLGTGSAGTGGSIQNCTVRGAEFISSNNITLKYMNINGNGLGSPSPDAGCADLSNVIIGVGSNANADCQSNIHLQSTSTVVLDTVTANSSKQVGINGNAVNGLTLTDVTASLNGDAINEDGVQLVNSTGTITVTRGVFKDNAANAFRMQNGTGTPTLNITGNNTATGGFFGNTNYPQASGSAPSPNNTTANSGIFLATANTNSAKITAVIKGVTIDRVYSHGLHADSAGNGTMDLTFGQAGAGNGNTVTNTGLGVVIVGTNSTGFTYSIVNNTFNQTAASIPLGFATNVISARKAGAGTWTGTISGNKIGTNTVARSGCDVSACNGITADAFNSSGTYTATITNNEVNEVNGAGIDVQSGGGSDSTVIKTTITGNTVRDPFIGAGSGSQNTAIFVQSGSVAGDTTTVKAQIDSNICSGSWNTPGNHSLIRVRERFTTTTFCLTNYNPANDYDGGGAGNVGDVATFLAQQNSGSTAPAGYAIGSASQIATAPAAGSVSGPSCPLLLAQGGIMAALNSPSLISAFLSSSFESPVFKSGPASISGGPKGIISNSITQPGLNEIVAAAIERWSVTGLTARQIATLGDLKFDVANLEGSYLGEADGNHILVDRAAQDKGWFIDSTPQDDSEFDNASGTRRYTDPMSAPAGHVDLLTALMHEMGHKLGLDDSYAEKDRDNLMYGYLTVGERRLPAQGQAANATASQKVAAHFLALPPDLIPAGDGFNSRGQRPRIAAQNNISDPVRVELNRPVQGREAFIDRLPAALPPAIESHAFGVNDRGSSPTVREGAEPQSGAMFIASEAQKNSQLRRSGILPATETNIALLRSAGTELGAPVYRHAVPTGRRELRSEIGDRNSEIRLNHARRAPKTISSATTNAAVAPMLMSPPPGTFPINGTGSGFSMPNGKTITITFSVTLNNPPNLAGVVPPKVSQQGTLTGAFSGNPIVTDDPNTVAANDATVTLVDLPDTTTTVSSSQNPSFVGQNVKFTATVASTGGVPTGSVQFRDGPTLTGTALGAPIALTTGGGCPVGSACATTPNISSLTSGNHTITADYTNADGNFDSGTGKLLPDPPGQTVNNKTSPTTTVLSSLNPSNVGDAVTFTAQVNSALATGTVQFWDGPSGTGTPLGSPVTLTTGGSCPGATACASTAAISNLTAGTHTITADYSGDVQFNASTGKLLPDPPGQTVNKKATTTTVTSAPNPSNLGQAVTFTAHVSGAGGTPTGTVQFWDGASGSTALGTPQTVNGRGDATFVTSSLNAGTHNPITADYSGDSQFAASSGTEGGGGHVVNTCAASIVVANTNDAGSGSLRDAISAICDGGTITFDPVAFAGPGSHTIELIDANGELLVNKNVTITGPGASVLTVQRAVAAASNFRVFEIPTTKTVSISGMTVSNGISTSGSGVRNDGNLTLDKVVVTGNNGPAADGGGIYNQGALTITNSTISNNTEAIGSFGAGIESAGAAATVMMINCTVSGNTGGSEGGGIRNSGGTFTIINSTISGNSLGDAAGLGGGIYNADTLIITNSTISGNNANDSGGGVYNKNGAGTATATLTSVTVTNNTADNDNAAGGTGGGINVASGTVTLKNTIVAGNFVGGPQVETATVAETAPGTLTAGNANVTVTAAGMTGSPKTVSVALALNDSEATVATKIRAALAADTDVNAFFTVSGSSTAVVLTARTAAANDATMNIAISDPSLLGLTPALTSADTTPGVAPTPDDIVGTVAASSSFNLIGTGGSGGLIDLSTDPDTTLKNQVGVADAKLGPLAANGGPTKTHALLAGSPALENGNAFSLTTDQRGFPRPINFDATPPVSPYDDTDIGAFERQTTPNAPGAPTLDAASDSAPVGAPYSTNHTTNLIFNISGVTLGATVQLFRDANPTPVASGVAPGNTIQLTDPGPLTTGTVYSYTAQQSLGSDTSPVSNATSVTIDTTPDAPNLDDASDTGASNTDNITNDTTPTFTITGVLNGAFVELLRDTNPSTGAVVVVSGTASGTSISLTDPGVNAGNYFYTARQTPSGGSASAQSASLSVTIQTTPDVPDLIAASDSGTSNSDNITNVTSPTFNITGVIVGANVELLRDSVSIQSGTAAGTSIQLQDPGATPNVPHTYTARQTPSGGSLSPESGGLPVTIDTTLPTVAISSTAPNPTNTSPIPFTVAFNEPVFGFTLSGITVGNGVKSNFVVIDAAHYGFDVTPAGQGLVSVDIAAGVATDTAGNPNTVATSVTRTFDSAPPTVLIGSPASNPTSTSPIPFTVTFNEPVSGFTSSDITVGNGAVVGASFLGSGANYSFDVTPAGQGPVSVDIAAGVATDTAGNLNTAAAQLNRTFDTSGPTVSITAVSPDPRNTSVSSIQIVFNKAVTGFDLADLTLKLNGGANLLTGAQTLTSGDNITWTLGNLSGLTGAEGTYVLKLTASGSNIKDAANNPLLSDATETWVMDTTSPTVTVSVDVGQANPVTGPTASTVINFKVVFSESVTGFIPSGVNLSGTAGATVANLSGSGTTYNVAVEGMTSSGAVTITIPASAAADAAGNGNTSVNPTNTATVTFNKDDFTTFEVNSLLDTDDGPCAPVGTGNGCTLREAINAANADAGAETITFAPALTSGGPATISLLTALPAITTDMTIQGPGANLLTVERNSGAGTNFRIFTINPGTVIISGLTISKGVLASSGQGGGIFNNTGATLTINNCAISGNQVGSSGFGGGIYSAGTLTLNSSTVNDNHVNTSGGGAGGIYDVGPLMNINNSTISGNTTGTDSKGGGILNTNALPLVISNSTVTLNTTGTGALSAGGGIYLAAANLTLKNSIVGGGNSSPVGPDISGTLQSDGFNLIQSTSGATINQNVGAGPNITGVDPLLFALANNGGPTFTHALQCTSPAIDKGKNFGLTTDQRGGTRPFDLADSVYPNAAGGDGSDIGAYETQTGGGCLPLAVPPAPAPATNEDTPVVITLTGTYSQNFALTFSITQQPVHSTANLVPSAASCTFTTFMTCTSTVSYTPSANFNGLDAFKFKASAGGLDSEEADVNITVNPVNDQPLALSQSVVTDEDTPLPITLAGADVETPAGSLAFTVTVQPLHGTLSGTAPNVTYTPNLNYNGPDSFKFTVTDTGDGPSPPLTSAAATISITVNAVNDAPVLDNSGNMSLSAINEDVAAASNTGTLVSGVIASAGGARITDVDAGAVQGLAVIAVDNTNGTWQFSMDNGTNWAPFGTPDSLNARLLAANATTRVRFLPNLNFNGTVDPGLTFRAWDQTSGTNGNTADVSIVGGTTAFSIAIETASITVNPVNDAPVLDNTGNMSLRGIKKKVRKQKKKPPRALTKFSAPGGKKTKKKIFKVRLKALR